MISNVPNIVVDESNDIRIVDLVSWLIPRSEKSEDAEYDPCPENPPCTWMSDKSAGSSFFHRRDQRTLEQKRRFALYGFGKTVWELYVRRDPVNEEELKSTPQWVQELVRACCTEDRVRSIGEVIRHLGSSSPVIS